VKRRVICAWSVGLIMVFGPTNFLTDFPGSVPVKTVDKVVDLDGIFRRK
jgi:hypothetical protein